jgi:hypothetical protein
MHLWRMGKPNLIGTVAHFNKRCQHCESWLPKWICACLHSTLRRCDVVPHCNYVNVRVGRRHIILAKMSRMRRRVRTGFRCAATCRERTPPLSQIIMLFTFLPKNGNGSISTPNTLCIKFSLEWKHVIWWTWIPNKPISPLFNFSVNFLFRIEWQGWSLVPCVPGCQWNATIKQRHNCISYTSFTAVSTCRIWWWKKIAFFCLCRWILIFIYYWLLLDAWCMHNDQQFQQNIAEADMCLTMWLLINCPPSTELLNNWFKVLEIYKAGEKPGFNCISLCIASTEKFLSCRLCLTMIFYLCLNKGCEIFSIASISEKAKFLCSVYFLHWIISAKLNGCDWICLTFQWNSLNVLKRIFHLRTNERLS